MNTVDPTRHDKLLRSMTALTFIVTATVVLLAAVGLPKIVVTANTAQAAQNSTAMQACRSFYNAKELAAAATKEGTANDTREVASRINILTLDALAAAATDNDTAFREAIAQVPKLRDDIAASSKTESDATAAQVSAAKTYQRELALSYSDPKQFLAGCQRDAP